MDNKFKVKNENCLLVEFVNEDSALAVGYRVWLAQNVSDQNLSQIIENEKEVEISWPKCDVQEAKKMTKCLKNLKPADWEPTVAKILGFGDWIKMHEQLDSTSKYNKPQTSKKERKDLVKRSVDVSIDRIKNPKKNKPKKLSRETVSRARSSNILRQLKKNTQPNYNEGMASESDEESSDDGVDEPLTKRSKQELQNDIRMLQVEKKQLQQKATKLSDEIQELQSIVKCSKALPTIEDALRNIISQLKTLDSHVSAASTDVISVSPRSHINRKRTLETAFIASRKNQLEKIQDVDGSSVQDLHNRDSNHDHCADDSVNFQESAGHHSEQLQEDDTELSSSCGTMKKPKISSVERVFFTSDRRMNGNKPDTLNVGSHAAPKMTTAVNWNDHKPSTSNNLIDVEVKDEPVEVEKTLNLFEATRSSEIQDNIGLEFNHDQDVMTEQEFSDESKTSNQDHMNLGGRADAIREVVTIGQVDRVVTEKKPDTKEISTFLIELANGVKISQSILDKIPHEQQSILTRRMLIALFSDSELANSSRSGKKGKNVEAKQKLDPVRLAAIKEYVKKTFKDKFDEKKFNETITEKCKTVRKAYVKK